MGRGWGWEVFPLGKEGYRREGECLQIIYRPGSVDTWFIFMVCIRVVSTGISFLGPLLLPEKGDSAGLFVENLLLL